MLTLKDLKTEYRTNPIGLDVRVPRFSWILESTEKETVQQAYHIIIKTGDNVVWDTNKQNCNQSVLIEYGGEALKPTTEYRVQVEVFDNYGKQAITTGTFETGLFTYQNFQGEWITHTLEETEACPVFVRSFPLQSKVKTARIYASSLGIYELTLNGAKVGDEFFAPGWTSYHNRLQYQTYDITEQLQEDNRLEMTVANGWYKGIFGFACKPNHYGDTLAAIAEVRVTYEDGTVESIGTDERWQCTTGMTRYSEIYKGEVVDHTIGTKESKPVKLLERSKSVLVAQECEPVRVTERLKPIEKIMTPKGEIVLDFGQNLTGLVEFQVHQEKGTCVTIHHAEVLDREGNFYTENLRGADSVDKFICSGNAETFMPRFTFHGFRYICVEGLADVNMEDFTACVLHTDMKKTGNFSCSHRGITKLQKNIQWGQRSNFLDIPTDCPQRDERLGWTGDIQIFGRTAAYNYDVALFLRKWLRDLKAEQTETKGVPHVVPNILGDSEGAAAWSDAATIVPWTLYLVYGDKKILAEQYESMKGWVEYIRSKADESHLWQSGHQYGDWVALDEEKALDTRLGATDVYLIATAYYAYSTNLVAKTAEILGFKKDAKEYEELHENIVEAFNEEYITRTGRIVSETQTGCILALHFGLAKERHRERILKSLVTNLARHRDHLVTGFVGTPYLCHVLSENGRHDLAGKIVLQDDYPSWLYSVKMGATTIWERWNSMHPDGSFDESGMNSFNHYAYGSIGDWMYQKLAGIQLIEPGYKKSKIAPEFIKGISNVKASVKTVYGILACAWRCKDKQITIDIEIPANTTAVVKLPERDEELHLGSGVYHYKYDTETVLEMDRYSMDTTLGQLLAEPLAVKMLEEMSPGMTEHPMIQYAFGHSISELSATMGAEGTQMMQVVIDALNKADTQNN